MVHQPDLWTPWPIILLLIVSDITTLVTQNAVTLCLSISGHYPISYLIISNLVWCVSLTSSSVDTDCPICLSPPQNPTFMRCCKKPYCKACIEKSLETSAYCPTCKAVVLRGGAMGNQPDGTMDAQVSHQLFINVKFVGVVSLHVGIANHLIPINAHHSTEDYLLCGGMPKSC